VLVHPDEKRFDLLIVQVGAVHEGEATEGRGWRHASGGRIGWMLNRRGTSNSVAVTPRRADIGVSVHHGLSDPSQSIPSPL
jgi:hypothetical protein